MTNTSVTVFLDLTTVTERIRATLSMDASGIILNIMFSSALFYSAALTLSNKVSLVRMELSSTPAVSLTASKAALRILLRQFNGPMFFI